LRQISITVHVKQPAAGVTHSWRSSLCTMLYMCSIALHKLYHVLATQPLLQAVKCWSVNCKSDVWGHQSPAVSDPMKTFEQRHGRETRNLPGLKYRCEMVRFGLDVRLRWAIWQRKAANDPPNAFLPIPPAQRSVARVVLFSVVSVCSDVCLST